MSRGNQNADTAFPTLKNIEEWEKECVRIDADITGLRQRKVALQSLIEGAKGLLPGDHEPTKKPANQRIKKVKRIAKRVARKPPKVEKERKTYKERGGSGTWTGTIRGILEKVGGGLTYEELRAEVMKTDLGEKLQQNDKSFYGAIARLADGEHLVRHKGRVFASAAYEQFMKDVAAGKAADTTAPLAAHKSPMTDAVRAFLKTREYGAVSGEIVSELKKNPEFVPTLERNKTHIYNILARLKSRDEIIKKGERYLLARANQEAA
jgi:hypothetical protein